MRRTREQSEAASKLKDLRQEQDLLTERSTYLTSLLRQQWENYRKHRYRQDLMLLISVLHEVNVVRERLQLLSRNLSECEQQLKQRSPKVSVKAAAERLKTVTLELKELNKRCREAEKEEAAAIERCVSVIEFMDFNDVYQLIRNKIEVLTTEKKMLQQVLKKGKK